MNKYSVSVILAGILWGSMGFWRRTMDVMGFSTFSVIFVRCGLAAVAFFLTILFTDRSRFRVALKDFWIFIGTGIVSLLFFTLCYFQAMQMMSLSTAAILLYTSPVFVILISMPCFGEKITLKKTIAMVMALGGCILVSGIGSNTSISAAGLLFGLGSGLCYGLYSIFSRVALNRGYSSITINVYTCALAAAGAVPFILGSGHGAELILPFATFPDFVFCLLASLVTCYFPYMLYTYGLSGLDNGKASIMASIEPVVATIFGFVLYDETLTIPGTAGILLVLGAIVLLNVSKSSKSA